MQTMAGTHIRPATVADIEALRPMLARANEAFRGEVPETLFESYLASAMDVEGRLRAAEVLVAELDGRVAGSITFYRDMNDEGMPVRLPGGTAGVRATAVDPIARGQGIGQRLVEGCISRAESVGATSIALHTASFMVAAIALYVRNGFRRAPEYDFEWSQFFPAEPGVTYPALAYVRQIP